MTATDTYAAYAADADEYTDPAADEPPSAGADLSFYYAEWIALHAVPSFVDFVDWLRGQLDEVGPTLSSRRQRRADGLFCRIVDLEVAFFDDALEQG